MYTRKRHAPPMMGPVLAVLLIAALWLAALWLAACSGAVENHRREARPIAQIAMPANPIRLQPLRDAPVVGLALQGMRFSITGKHANCEWLKVQLPSTLNHLGDEGWIIGPPKFARIEGGGCANIPDLTPQPTPAG